MPINLKDIKENLPYGASTMIFQRLKGKYKLSTIRWVLSGRSQNIDILEAAAEIALENQKRRANLQEKLQALGNTTQ